MYTCYVYKIYNSVDDKIYIGSTKQRLTRRMGTHRQCAKKRTTVLYMHMRKIGISKFYIVELQRVDVEDRQAQMKLEVHWQEKLKPELNMNRAYATDEQSKEAHNKRAMKYYEKNKEQCKNQMKKYREKNKKEIADKDKKYREACKNVIQCHCSVLINIGHSRDRKRHFQSRKHKAYVASVFGGKKLLSKPITTVFDI